MVAKCATIGVDGRAVDLPHTTQPKTELMSTGWLSPRGIRPGLRNSSKKISAPIMTSTGLVSANDGSAS